VREGHDGDRLWGREKINSSKSVLLGGDGGRGGGSRRRTRRRSLLEWQLGLGKAGNLAQAGGSGRRRKSGMATAFETFYGRGWEWEEESASLLLMPSTEADPFQTVP
jgi:hypothetical protein